MNNENNIKGKLKNTFIGKARDLTDRSVFQRISLVAFFAWVGLGSDPLSSSCYGPEEIMRNLTGHGNLGIFVAILTVITIFVISTSYRQIINLFPQGGGGYIVATKLISPTIGMISGSALLIDYMLTITLSISSGADAFFSFLPAEWHGYKLIFSFFILLVLVVLNLRGVKESVMLLTPVFIAFILTHAILIGYSIFTHIGDAPELVRNTGVEMSNSISQLGVFGTIFLILKAYSMGAGTYTGIEAVSNGIPNLREPKVKTAQKTMLLLSVSLAIAAFGLIISYYLFDVKISPTKTLNAVLVETATSGWNYYIGQGFVFLTLISEAALLFVAAQTGFLDGPRVMANMAHDNWFPRKFTHLSDRLVSQNGILIMGGAAFLLLYFSKGAVSWLVILYSINVFITFTLSQFGMVRHWILVRKEEKKWFWKMAINGIGLIMTTFILFTVLILKFEEGGWITVVITGVLSIIAVIIKRHYNFVRKEIIEIQKKIKQVIPDIISVMKSRMTKTNNNNSEIKTNRTVVLLVNGYGGLGLYSLFKTLNDFNGNYQNIVFVEVGIMNSSRFKGFEQIDKLKENIEIDMKKYIYVAEKLGLHGDSYYAIGTDVVEEIDKLIPVISEKYPNPVFVGGQLIFEGNTFFNKLLHNYTIFAIQRNLYKHGITTIVIPIPMKISELMAVLPNESNY
ncbi:MAG: APC family permease [Bacteroidia bacterium]|nr:APC family permease [Bacteroidia bacterium]